MGGGLEDVNTNEQVLAGLEVGHKAGEQFFKRSIYSFPNREEHPLVHGGREDCRKG